jgi:hypothetical protein
MPVREESESQEDGKTGRELIDFALKIPSRLPVSLSR